MSYYSSYNYVYRLFGKDFYKKTIKAQEVLSLLFQKNSSKKVSSYNVWFNCYI